tara:strand:- start:275 stop:949 length:675 start_codon:yes stop_codon:yes gene_type:complete
MSDLTDFFPAAGGGSFVSYDPLTLDRTAIPGGNIFMKTNYAATQNPTGANFWLYYEDYSDGVGDYVQLPPTTSVYQTIVDVTNTGKGGKLLNIISPLLYTSNTLTFKITIDGTETLIPVVGISSYTRLVLGGLIEGKPTTGQGTYGPAYTYRSGAYDNNYSANQKNYNGFHYSGIQYFMIPTSPAKTNHIEFKDSCKVEMIYTGTLASYWGTTDKRGGAMIIQN